MADDALTDTSFEKFSAFDAQSPGGHGAAGFFRPYHIAPPFQATAQSAAGGTSVQVCSSKRGGCPG